MSKKEDKVNKEANYEKALKGLNKIFNPKGIKFESADDYIARIKKEMSR